MVSYSTKNSRNVNAVVLVGVPPQKSCSVIHHFFWGAHFKAYVILGGWFQIFGIFTPWGNDPIWLAHIFFRMGGKKKHHQPVMLTWKDPWSRHSFDSRLGSRGSGRALWAFDGRFFSVAWDTGVFFPQKTDMAGWKSIIFNRRYIFIHGRAFYIDPW